MKIEKNNDKNKEQCLFDKTLINCSLGFKKEIDENKYFIPICREIGCNGHLKISINEEKFLVNGICNKNNNHKFNDLYLETFERFYLKENTTQNCYNCSKNLENECKFECYECNKLLCSNCFSSEIHIKKNIKNLKVIENPSLIDKNKIINILKKMPTKNKLSLLKRKINKKSESFNYLIKSINEWQNELNKKIERLKQNLMNEIRIIKKLFLNFNIKYIDDIYYSNFHNFLRYIENYNNKNLEKFLKTHDLYEKTKYMLEIILTKKQEINNYHGKLEKISKISNNHDLKYLNNQSFLLYSYKSNSFRIISNDINRNSFQEIYKLDCNQKIGNISFSPDKTKIYACSDEKKYIYIINYNPIKNILEYSDDYIERNSNGIFKNCIYINDNCLIAETDYSLYLFHKYTIINKFKNKKKISFEDIIISTCLINEKEIVISQNMKITFLSIDKLQIEKEIKNIDCSYKNNNLILIDDHILVDCEEGIAIISIKTKEMIQYIQDPINFGEKIIAKSYDNNIYILNSFGEIFKYRFYEYNLILLEKTLIEKHLDEENDSYLNFEELDFEDTSLIIKKDNIYIMCGSLFEIFIESDNKYI